MLVARASGRLKDIRFLLRDAIIGDVVEAKIMKAKRTMDMRDL